MNEKPPKVKTLYVPIYEHDTAILERLPPTATGQWARQLLLRQLQIDDQMMGSFHVENGDEEVSRAEIKRVIQDELEPILGTLDDTMDKVINEKLQAMQQALMAVIQETIQSALNGITTAKPVQEGNLPPQVPTEGNSGTPAWQQALTRGIAQD